MGQVTRIGAKVMVRIPEILDDVEVAAIGVGSGRIVGADGSPSTARVDGLRVGDYVLVIETSPDSFVVVCPIVLTGRPA